MLKRIEASQVRPGMFIEAVEGAWNDPQLGRHRFLVRRESDAQRLRGSGVAAVVINTAKGVDTNGLRSNVPAYASEDPRAVEAQTKAARETLQKSAEQLEDVFSRIQSGSGVALDDVAPVISGLSTSLDDNPAIFLSVTRLKSKDETTFLHSLSVSALMIHFSRYLDFDEETVRILGIAGLLHDVGKLEIPQEILSKEGKLDDEEMKLIRSHPELGHAILKRQAGMPDIVLDVCLNHHERIDGRGYPNMIPGTKLSIYARLSAICDVYDAITSIRPYKQPWSPADALKWMLGREGHFDTKLLKRFALCLSVASAPKA